MSRWSSLLGEIPNPPCRILFVDDEPGIRMTLPSILGLHGYDVTTAANVPDALEAINHEKFDVLLADLNIGQPGDGFTVVSAMRRTQPAVVTIIITGYPAFETALEAIRNQVDDYIVKPANIPGLLDTIERRLVDRKPRHPLPLRRVAVILRDHLDQVVSTWLTMAKGDPEISAVTLSDAERADHVPLVVHEAIETLEDHRGVISDTAIHAATAHGHTRREQGYSVSMLLKEGRYLRRAALTIVQTHLLSVDISYLLSDLIDICESLDVQIRTSVEAFLAPQTEPRAA
jgi:YesN/AraC family two-component response regulator